MESVPWPFLLVSEGDLKSQAYHVGAERGAEAASGERRGEASYGRRRRRAGGRGLPAVPGPPPAVPACAARS